MRRRSRRTEPPIANANPPPPLPALLPTAVSLRAIVTPVVANAFDQVRISVALWITGDWWYPIHVIPNVVGAEYENSVAPRRFAYNQRCFAEVHRSREAVVGEHAGFFDFFAPVIDSDVVRGVLVAGPFARSRPTSAQILERWYAITGAQGRLADPPFADYVAATLATLTLEEQHFEAFARLMWCFASLLGGQGSPEALAAEVERLRSLLMAARSSDLMWEAARSMVDERNTRFWAAPPQAGALASLGVKQLPEHVVVGLLRAREDERDSLDVLLRRDAVQRECVALARKSKSMVCGQVGDHGVVFLCDDPSPAPQVERKLVDLASRASAVARLWGFRFHAGISRAEMGARLPARYRSALGAAEKALSRGLSVVHGERRPERSAEHLRQLRSRLGESVGDRASLLSPRFDRYIEAVLAHCGHRLETSRAHLEAGLERLAEPLLSSGSLDKKGFSDFLVSMERTFEEARTVMDLASSYRRLVADIESALHSPTRARRDRATRRASHFVREHLGEPLTLAQVARVAGFAPGYFSKLFKRDEGVTFERYVRDRRVERAKQMLSGTSLNVEQVQKLCGFTTRTYFHRVFKRVVGVTPAEFRSSELHLAQGTLKRPARDRPRASARSMS
jgi:AraC-like DNA-binding protein